MRSKGNEMAPRVSRRPDDVRIGRAFLVSVRGRSELDLPNYEEFASSYGGIAQGAGPVLNSIAAACIASGEPDLSALVVAEDTRLPGSFNGQPLRPGDSVGVSTWRQMLAEIRGYPWADESVLMLAPPKVGESFHDRSAIRAVWGGDIQGGMATFPRGDARVVNIFSDDEGPYPDRRVPGTDRIEYIGQGRTGDQSLTLRGNVLMERARTAGEAARYWHKPTGGDFTFERWVVIVGRHREGQKAAGVWRRAYVYDLAPVGSPESNDWPVSVREEVNLRSVDDALPPDAPDADAPGAPSKTELYQRLANRAAAGAGRAAGTRTAAEYARSAAARDAVLLRAEDRCESPRCNGMACDVRPDGASILDVDHIQDLAKKGADEPWNMIALCPNCHAAKTRGRDRKQLQKLFRQVARLVHDQALGGVQK
jgi:5-methylcytosine-specific restriction protein A